MPKSKIFLPDVNVWLAFAVEAHVHHDSAERWLDEVGVGQAAFCRVTQMALLRLLTNAQVMQASVLTQNEAWSVYDQLRKDERIVFQAEPDGIEDRWRSLSPRHSSSAGLWSDSYLRALADLADLRLVTLDKKLGASHADAVVLS